MKYLFSLLFMAALVMSCQSDKTDSKSPAGKSNKATTEINTNLDSKNLPTDLVGTEWAFEHVSMKGQIMPVSPVETSFLKIDKEGNVTGIAGCNAFEGQLFIQDGEVIRIMIRPSKNMSCEDKAYAGAESRIRKILEKSRSYEIRDNLLWIDAGPLGRLAYRSK